MGNGLGTVWERFGNGLETVWERFGNGLETIWERFTNGFGTVGGRDGFSYVSKMKDLLYSKYFVFVPSP